MVRHLAEGQHPDAMSDGIDAEISKIDQMLADRVEQQETVDGVLIAMVQNTTEESAIFHSFRSSLP